MVSYEMMLDVLGALWRQRAITIDEYFEGVLNVQNMVREQNTRVVFEGEFYVLCVQ